MASFRNLSYGESEIIYPTQPGFRQTVSQQSQNPNQSSAISLQVGQHAQADSANVHAIQQQQPATMKQPWFQNLSSSKPPQHIRELIDTDQAIHDDDVRCQMCDVTYRKPARKACMECEVYFCEYCLEEYHSRGPYRDHKLVAPEALMLDAGHRCHIHGEKHKLLCLTCGELICSLCRDVGSHGNHEAVLLKEGQVLLKESLVGVLCSLSNIHESHKKAPQDDQRSWEPIELGIKEIKEALENASKTYEEQVERKVKDLYEIVEDLRDYLLREQEKEKTAVIELLDSSIAAVRKNDLNQLVQKYTHLFEGLWSVQWRTEHLNGGFPRFTFACNNLLSSLKVKVTTDKHNLQFPKGHKGQQVHQNVHFSSEDDANLGEHKKGDTGFEGSKFMKTEMKSSKTSSAAGSRKFSYKPFEETDSFSGWKYTYQSITAMPEYHDTSSEELRHEDYTWNKENGFAKNVQTQIQTKKQEQCKQPEPKQQAQQHQPAGQQQTTQQQQPWQQLPHQQQSPQQQARPWQQGPSQSVFCDGLTKQKSLFGGQTFNQNGLFGGQAANQNGLFGGQAATAFSFGQTANQKGFFGGQATTGFSSGQTANQKGLFGGQAANQKGLFGGQSANQNGLFGGEVANQKGLFGGQAATGLFCGQASNQKSMFGVQASNQNNLFGGQASNQNSSFGGQTSNQNSLFGGQTANQDVRVTTNDSLRSSKPLVQTANSGFTFGYQQIPSHSSKNAQQVVPEQSNSHPLNVSVNTSRILDAPNSQNTGGVNTHENPLFQVFRGNNTMNTAPPPPGSFVQRTVTDIPQQSGFTSVQQSGFTSVQQPQNGSSFEQQGDGNGFNFGQLHTNAFGSSQPAVGTFYSSQPAASSAIGSSQTSANAFGSSQPAASTIASSQPVANVFGSTQPTATAFGSSLPYSNASATSGFGSSQPATSAFGSIQPAVSAFGAASGFGSNQSTADDFNKPATSLFGSRQPVVSVCNTDQPTVETVTSSKPIASAFVVGTNQSLPDQKASGGLGLTAGINGDSVGHQNIQQKTTFGLGSIGTSKSEDLPQQTVPTATSVVLATKNIPKAQSTVGQSNISHELPTWVNLNQREEQGSWNVLAEQQPNMTMYRDPHMLSAESDVDSGSSDSGDLHKLKPIPQKPISAAATPKQTRTQQESVSKADLVSDPRQELAQILKRTDLSEKVATTGSGFAPYSHIAAQENKITNKQFPGCVVPTISGRKNSTSSTATEKSEQSGFSFGSDKAHERGQSKSKGGGGSGFSSLKGEQSPLVSTSSNLLK